MSSLRLAMRASLEESQKSVVPPLAIEVPPSESSNDEMPVKRKYKFHTPRTPSVVVENVDKPVDFAAIERKKRKEAELRKFYEDRRVSGRISDRKTREDSFDISNKIEEGSASSETDESSNDDQQQHHKFEQQEPSSSSSGQGPVGAKAVEWVQCERETCKKWRKLPENVRSSELPEKWYCEMNNWDPTRASCSAAEDVHWSDRMFSSGRGGRRGRVWRGGGRWGRRMGKAESSSSSSSSSRQQPPMLMMMDRDNSADSSSSHHVQAVDNNVRWVMCEACHAWRTVPAEIVLPDVWRCELNTWNTRYASCSAPEETVVYNKLPNRFTPVWRSRWVQCERETCKKWRKLPENVRSSELPEKWYCEMNNWDPTRASCSAAEDVDDRHVGHGKKRHLVANMVGQKNQFVLSYRRMILGSDGRVRSGFSDKYVLGHGIFSTAEPQKRSNEHINPTRKIAYWSSSVYDGIAVGRRSIKRYLDEHDSFDERWPKLNNNLMSSLSQACRHLGGDSMMKVDDDDCMLTMMRKSKMMQRAGDEVSLLLKANPGQTIMSIYAGNPMISNHQLDVYHKKLLDGSLRQWECDEEMFLVSLLACWPSTVQVIRSIRKQMKREEQSMDRQREKRQRTNDDENDEEDDDDDRQSQPSSGSSGSESSDDDNDEYFLHDHGAVSESDLMIFLMRTNFLHSTGAETEFCRRRFIENPSLIRKYARRLELRGDVDVTHAPNGDIVICLKPDVRRRLYQVDNPSMVIADAPFRIRKPWKKRNHSARPIDVSQKRIEVSS